MDSDSEDDEASDGVDPSRDEQGGTSHLINPVDVCCQFVTWETF